MTKAIDRRWTAVVPVAVTVALLALPATAAAQAGQPAKAPAKKSWTPPRTPWGEPDLQGVYSNRTITPFERPAEFAGKETLTDAETAELERRGADPRAAKREAQGSEGGVSRPKKKIRGGRGTEGGPKQSAA